MKVDTETSEQRAEAEGDGQRVEESGIEIGHNDSPDDQK